MASDRRSTVVFGGMLVAALAAGAGPLGAQVAEVEAPPPPTCSALEAGVEAEAGPPSTCTALETTPAAVLRNAVGGSLSPAGVSSLVSAPALVPAEVPARVPPFQVRDRSGIPYIIAGSALIVGGAIVGDDAGTLLMVGGVLAVSWGLYIYF